MNTFGNNGGEPTSLADRVRSLKLASTAIDRRPPKASKLPWLLCLLLAGLCAYLGHRVFIADPAKALETKESSPAVVAAQAPPKPNEPQPGAIVLEAGGYVIPVRQVQVSPKVGGQVIELFIEEGQLVKKDQIIAKLDRTEYDFEYQRMKALAEQAQAKYEELKNGNRTEEKKQSLATLREAEEQLSQLRDEASRLRRAIAATSPDEVVKVESRLKQAIHRAEQLRQADKMMQDGARSERIAAAKAEYDHAIAQCAKAKYALDNTDVLAPVTGVILEKKAEVGDTVLPNVPSNGLSASLCKMANLRELEVDVDISERDLARVVKDQKCQIRTEAFPDVVYTGKVSRLMPLANRSKASVSARVHIEVPETDRYLRPEMRARVQFLAAAKDKPTHKDKPTVQARGTPSAAK